MHTFNPQITQITQIYKMKKGPSEFSVGNPTYSGLKVDLSCALLRALSYT